MNLKTSPTLAIENFKQLSDSYDLELLGCPSPYDNSISSFEVVFGKNVKFFYKAVTSQNNLIVNYEIGLAYLEGNTLKRFKPLYHGTSGADIFASNNGPQFFAANDGQTLVVTSHNPLHLNELLCDANSVITSVAPHVSHPVSLSENSFLGRLDDNVQSIPFSTLFTNQELINLITQTIISYVSTLLTTRSVSTDNLQLNVVKKSPKTKGTLSFDGENLKYYDGKKYRVLQWRFEDE